MKKIFITTTALLIACTLSAADLFVSPKGNDRNPGTKDSPKATLTAALRQARELRRLNDESVKGGITIHMEAGDYHLYEPVFIRPEDSGTEASPTVITSDGNAILNGGVEIRNWKKQGKLWVADVPMFNGRPLDFRQLWINGQKAVRARDVADFEKMYRIINNDPQNEILWVPAAAVKKIQKARYAEMVLHEMWCVANLRIKSVEIQGDSAAVRFHNPESRIQFEHPWPRPMVTKDGHNSAFYLTNAMELLDEPGEWYHDIESRKIYYYPRKGEKISKAVVPGIETLVWVEGKSFVDYITRCQTLLQYGHPVADIAVFTGEEMPRRSILPERLVSMLPGIYGAERVESERIRLANEGQPTRVRPVGVTHSANMADPEDWVNPMRGYAYDSFNKDALLRLAKAENGRMVLPGGASYKVLVLPTARPMNPDNLPLSPEAQAKVEELRVAGVIIPKLPYREDDFSSFGVERDVLLPADVAYTHRSGEEYEIYFVANQVDSLRTFNASFRIAGRTPELWNAVTGTITRPAQWKEANGRTEVALSLPANGSVFVVFPKEYSEVSPERTEREPVSILIKEWTVTFPSVRKTVTRPALFDWSKEEDEKIRYYAGHATYRGLFRWKNEQDGRIILRLGKVANVATVRVNSIACGTAWTAPYEVDITDALRNGTNVLEVEVVNTWANALRGADLDKAPFEGIWTNAKFRLPGDDLLPAGWMGPCEFFKTKE